VEAVPAPPFVITFTTTFLAGAEAGTVALISV